MKHAAPKQRRDESKATLSVQRTGDEQLVTFRIDSQLFGIPALRVRDILRHQYLTRVPLAPPYIAGSINLRGHIVTAVNIRVRIGSAAKEGLDNSMCVVVEHLGESYCLIVDSVGDVIRLNDADIEPNPASLASSWVELSKGITRTSDGLLLLLDLDKLLTW